MQYRILYAINPTFQVGDLVIERLAKTHVYLVTVEAATLDDAWAAMQGERWSPNGEARRLILSKGLHHTSMSIGDVLQTADGRYYQVADAGFREVPSLNVTIAQKRQARDVVWEAMASSGIMPWENRSPSMAPHVFRAFSQAAGVVGLPGLVGILWPTWSTRGFEGDSVFCYLQRVTIGGIGDGEIEYSVGIWSLPIQGRSSKGWAKSLVDDLVRIRKGNQADRQIRAWWLHQQDFNFAERIEEG